MNERIPEPDEPSFPAENEPARETLPPPCAPDAEARSLADGVEHPGATDAPSPGAADTPAEAATAAEPDRGAQAGPKEEARQAPRPRNPAAIRAFRSGRPMEGKIVQVIKGGYEVRIGRARAFCPHSQLDVHRENDPASQVGRTYAFRITQLRRGGQDLVVSRRVLLEEQQQEEAKAVRATLVKDAVMQGHVVGVTTFGAFVDLGAGVRGLVHVSELSHSRVTQVDQAVRVGQTVRVKLLKIDEGTGRISLSMRQAEDDPWQGVAERFKPGATYPGTVQRLADFGAFVTLAPGVEGLAPASEFPPSPGGWQRGLVAGEARDWYVLAVDPRQRRVTLTLPADGAAATAPVQVGATLTGRVQRVESFGVFVWLGPGQVGLMPKVLTGTPPGTDLARRFGVGDEVEVSIVEVSDDRKRIRVCKAGVEPAPASAPRPAPRKREEPMPAVEHATRESEGTFGTSLADKLRDALGKRGEG